MDFRFSFLVVMFATLAVASEEFDIIQPVDRPWKIGDRACVTVDQQSVCGKVIQANEATAVVRKEVQGKGVTFVPLPSPKQSTSPAELETPRPARPRMAPTKKKAPRNFRWNPLPSAAPELVPQPVITPPPNPFPAPSPTPVPIPVPAQTTAPLLAPWGQPVSPSPAASAPISPVRPEKPPPKPAAATTATRQTMVAGPNLALGVNYFFPGLGVVIALGETTSVGANFFYAKANVSGAQLTAIGGFLSLSYFIKGIAPFGWFLTGGAGGYSLTGKTSTREDKLSSPTALGLVGWRGASRMGLGGGIGAGMQYAFGAKSDTIKFHGPLPVVLIEITFAF